MDLGDRKARGKLCSIINSHFYPNHCNGEALDMVFELRKCWNEWSEEHFQKYESKRIVGINYADDAFLAAQKLNTTTALCNGIDEVLEYGRKDIDEDFYKKNQRILDSPRGGGYWLWKPYIVYKTMTEHMGEGEYLIYCDSGAMYINNVKSLINEMNREKTDIMAFTIGAGYLEKHYTKRDAFVLMECDVKECADSPQNFGTFFLLKKSKRSIQFVADWLHYAQDERVITDDDNVMGYGNYDGFRDHRHDQSIFSLLVKKSQLNVFRSPRTQGSICDAEIVNRSQYPPIFLHHRISGASSVGELLVILKEKLQSMDCAGSKSMRIIQNSVEVEKKFRKYMGYADD